MKKVGALGKTNALIFRIFLPTFGYKTWPFAHFFWPLIKMGFAKILFCPLFLAICPLFFKNWPRKNLVFMRVCGLFGQLPTFFYLFSEKMKIYILIYKMKKIKIYRDKSGFLATSVNFAQNYT